jgi:hypothetical protein
MCDDGATMMEQQQQQQQQPPPCFASIYKNDGTDEFCDNIT